MKLAIIGDVHDRVADYKRLLGMIGNPPSVQLGDLGISFDKELLATIDPERHRFIPGNHDLYPDLPAAAFEHPYGVTTHGGIQFFYLRGALSPDRVSRTQGISWWPEEEIGYLAGTHALALYERTKPRIVLTHDCPIEVTKEMGLSVIPSRTSQLLSCMFAIHQPTMWLFGHYHNNLVMERVELKGKSTKTHFRCLGVLSAALIERVEDGTFLGKTQVFIPSSNLFPEDELFSI